MNISAINTMNTQGCKPKFAAARNGEYENPINRKTERNLAILENAGKSVLAGTVAAGIASCFKEGGFAANKKFAIGTGAAAALATAALTLPPALYKTKVNAFTKEKEMDVFSRERELKSNIMEEVNKEVKDDYVDLDKKINHYTSVQMANNGRGLLFKEA